MGAQITLHQTWSQDYDSASKRRFSRDIMISVVGRMTEGLEGRPESAPYPGASTANPSGMDVGIQPLDAIMSRHQWSNHDLVVCSPDDLTHKVIQKGRKGRRITRRAQQKILLAVNRAAAGTAQFTVEELFNYRGR